MTSRDRLALQRIGRAGHSVRASADDLQNLLLQVVFALLMVFIIAYFIFVSDQRAERHEQVMELNRQKLTLAMEKTAEGRRVRYGLNAMMTQGTDGTRTFDPDGYVKDGRLSLAPVVKKAFAAGSRVALNDYSDLSRLGDEWRRDVLAEAGLATNDLSRSESEWLEGELAAEIDRVRLDVRGVQRSLAARLQKQLVDRPEVFAGVADLGEVVALLKEKSLRMVAEETGAEVLP